jgi:hypothetical protein
MDRAFSGAQPAESRIHRHRKARDPLTQLANPPMTEGLTAAGGHGTNPPMTEGLTAAGGHGGQWRGGGASERARS